MTTKQSVDLILYPRWLAPMSATPAEAKAGAVVFLENHACVVHQGKTLDVLPQDKCRQKYSAQFEYNLSTHLLMPGLFNGHAHSAMALLRGFADDYPLMTWLQEHIWPAEGKHVSESFVKTGSELAICEMLASGITCFNDMYFFPGTLGEVLRDAGLKGSISGPILEFPTPWAQNADEYLAKNTDLIKEFNKGGDIQFGYGPHAPYTVSDATFEKIIDQAQANNTWIHTHLHETAFEVQQSMTDFGMRPVARLAKLGLFDVHSQAVHMTQINDEDIENLSGKKCHIIHCPESNLKLASGFSPIQKLYNAGLNINIGTDGAASNNDLDMVSETRTAALLAKAVAEDAEAFPAYQAMYSATRGGALAFGRDKMGSIQTGFEADMIAVNLDDLNTQPVFDPIAQFVYASNNRQISHVWVNGKLVCEHGQVRVIDTDKVRHDVEQWRQKLKG